MYVGGATVSIHQCTSSRSMVDMNLQIQTDFSRYSETETGVRRWVEGTALFSVKRDTESMEDAPQHTTSSVP